MLGAIATGIGVGSSVFNYFNSRKANQLQEQAYDYQKALNEQVMAREDSTYQRTVADMEKAGLNPLNLSAVNSASSLSSGQAPSIVPQFDMTNAISALNTFSSNNTQKETSRLANATNASIAEMQQRGVDMANAYNHEVGMANAFANQLNAITNFKRAGIDDPAVLKALKEQIIAEAKNAQNNARGSGSTADLLEQEYQGRQKSGTYRGMSNKVADVKDTKSLVDEISSSVDDLNSTSSSDSGNSMFNSLLKAVKRQYDQYSKPFADRFAKRKGIRFDSNGNRIR